MKFSLSSSSESEIIDIHLSYSNFFYFKTGTGPNGLEIDKSCAHSQCSRYVYVAMDILTRGVFEEISRLLYTRFDSIFFVIVRRDFKFRLHLACERNNKGQNEMIALNLENIFFCRVAENVK